MSNELLAFYCSHDSEETVARLPSLYGLLSSDEKCQMEGLPFKWQQTEYLINRALVRSSLSQYDRMTDPRDWRFTYAPEGRPFIQSPQKQLYFSLSHTRGLSVCLVAPFPEIGIDVECTESLKDIDSIARHFFSPQENFQIRSNKDPHQTFFKFWTLKEAYLKAKSIGITVRLNSFYFDLEEDTIRLYDPKVTANWSFFTNNFADHQISMAVRGSFKKMPSLVEMTFVETGLGDLRKIGKTGTFY